MWSKKWYLKRNISCDSDLLKELLETDVPWDDAILVSAGKLRKLWDSLRELCSSVYERRLERTVLRPALLPVKTAHYTQFFRQVWRHTVKSVSLTQSVQRTLWGFFPLGWRGGCESDPYTSRGISVRNDWISMEFPPKCLHNFHRDFFIYLRHLHLQASCHNLTEQSSHWALVKSEFWWIEGRL
jgi:hypothetical protein